MAHPSHALATILFMSPLILAIATASLGCCPCPYTCENEINWRLYLKQVGGTGPDHNQEGIFVPPNANKFGQTVVQDWTIIDAPVPNAKVLGHAQGVSVLSDLANVNWFVSLNIVFQGDRFSGSTLQVMGILPPEGEWAIVGGTGELALARGTIKHKVAASTPTTNFRQLDIHAFYANNSVNSSAKVIVENGSAQEK